VRPHRGRREAADVSPWNEASGGALRHTAGMNTNEVARIASLVGEPARTAMLVALVDGRALTAGELARASHVTPATASRHLALMLDAGLLQVEQQGRHRYFRLASVEVARVLESMMQIASTRAAPTPVRTGPRDAALRFARTCYDHLAGRLAVAIFDHLVEEGALVVEEDGARLTDRAPAVFGPLDLLLPSGGGREGGAATAPAPSAPTPTLPQRGREANVPSCRPCLDWGERRMHLAGRMGRLLCTHTLQRGWLLRKPGARVLELTPSGAGVLRDWLGVRRWSGLVDA
jgi:DNA-binding transcriptional ArsR family regulator